MSNTTAIRTDHVTALTPLVERFVQFYLGRRPRIDICFAGDVVLIRLIDSLTDAESRLVESDTNGSGRDAVETLFRKMAKQAQAGFVSAVETTLAATVRAFHVDLDASTGEGLIALALDKELAN